MESTGFRFGSLSTFGADCNDVAIPIDFVVFVVFRVCYCLYLVQCTKDPVAYRRCGDLSNDLSALPQCTCFIRKIISYLLTESFKEERLFLEEGSERFLTIVCCANLGDDFFRKYAALFPPDRPLLLGIEWAMHEMHEKSTEAMPRPQCRDPLPVTTIDLLANLVSFFELLCVQPSQWASLAWRASWQVSCSSSLQLKSFG